MRAGRAFATAPPEKPQDVTLRLGDREFNSTLKQPGIKFGVKKAYGQTFDRLRANLRALPGARGH